jgi:GT2 family glycosyltransferase
MKSPLVSIIILNWNGEKFIKECIDSVLKTDYPQKEIIFVDNGSTDNSLNIVNSYSNSLHLVAHSQNLGFAAGMNSGIKAAHGEYVVTLNNDLIVDKNWLQRPVEILSSNPEVGIISCRQMVYGKEDLIDIVYSRPSPYLLPAPVGSDQKYSEHPEFHTEREVSGASGASVIYRKTLLDQFDGFDERFFAYHEESDLQTRACKSGWKCIYVPSAVVFHMGSRSFGKLSRTFHYYHERNRWWYIAKNYSLLKILLHLPWLIFMELRLIRVIFLKSKCPDVYFRARIDAIKGLIKYRLFKQDYKYLQT